MVNQCEEGNAAKNSTQAKEIWEDAKEKNCACDEKDGKNRFEFDPVLLRYRVFFFLFYGGFGTTFPYLGIYFKQIGLSAASVGVLAGVRPLIQFISGPFWSILADKYKARKLILMFSILSWLVMTSALAFPRPHDVKCKRVNDTVGNTKGGLSKQASGQKKDKIPNIAFTGHIGEVPLPDCFPACTVDMRHRARRDIQPRKNILSYLDRDEPSLSHDKSYMKHDIKINTVLSNNNNNHKKSNTTKMVENINANHHYHYVIEHNPVEMRNVFIVLLMLIISGEFLEAPTFILTDTALLEHLGEKRTNYGKTRLFGSIGYGLASFGIGAILDRTHYVYCGKNMVNYTFLFYVYAGFMVIGFFFALFAVNFSYEKSKINNSSLKEVLQLFRSLKISSFLAIAWFLGFVHGGVMNFLNWYLEDLGATRFMMGVGTLCRSFAIISGFLSSNYFLNKFGHLNMILCTLVVYTLSFFGYSLIPNPWYALPIECGQGFCYSISWSASITYLGAAAPKNAAATVQGVLQGVYWGLGTGLGAFVGGAMINTLGAILSFRIGGMVSAVVVFIMLIINHVVNSKDRKDVKEKVSTKLKDFKSVISSSK